MDFKCSILSRSLSTAFCIQIYLCGKLNVDFVKGKFSSFPTTFVRIFHSCKSALYAKNKTINFSSGIFLPFLFGALKTDNEMELANFKLQPTLIKSTSFSCNCSFHKKLFFMQCFMIACRRNSSAHHSGTINSFTVFALIPNDFYSQHFNCARCISHL